MHLPPIELVVAYLLYAQFLFYLQLWVKNFGGAWKGLHNFLGLWGLLAMIFDYGFLVYLFFKTLWYWPLMLWGLGMALHMPCSWLEFHVSKRYRYFPIAIGMIAIGALPLLGVLLVISVS